MTLIFSNHRFQYEVERLFRNFINEPGIKLSTDKADARYRSFRADGLSDPYSASHHEEGA